MVTSVTHPQIPFSSFPVSVLWSLRSITSPSYLLPTFLFSSSTSREPRLGQLLSAKTIPSHLECSCWCPRLSPALGCKLLRAPQHPAQGLQIKAKLHSVALGLPTSLTSFRPSPSLSACTPAILAFFFLLAVPCGMWALGSPTRD